MLRATVPAAGRGQSLADAKEGVGCEVGGEALEAWVALGVELLEPDDHMMIT